MNAQFILDHLNAGPGGRVQGLGQDALIPQFGYWQGVDNSAAELYGAVSAVDDLSAQISRGQGDDRSVYGLMSHDTVRVDGYAILLISNYMIKVYRTNVKEVIDKLNEYTTALDAAATPIARIDQSFEYDGKENKNIGALIIQVSLAAVTDQTRPIAFCYPAYASAGDSAYGTEVVQKNTRTWGVCVIGDDDNNTVGDRIINRLLGLQSGEPHGMMELDGVNFMAQDESANEKIVRYTFRDWQRLDTNG